MYLTIFYRSFLIAKHSRSHFNGLISFGLGLTVMIQAAVNMGVSVSLIPVTGQSLPFLSHGGSSLLFTGISLGIIQSIARQNEEEDMAEAERIDELEGA
jgi:cell division protein FtsW